jgi:hypothetical protein
MIKYSNVMTATTNVNSATTTTTFRDGSGRITGTATRNNR